jgi:hypothetical protein
MAIVAIAGMLYAPKVTVGKVNEMLEQANSSHSQNAHRKPGL